MSEPAATVPDQGLVARASGILFSPSQTFRTVVAYPRPASMLFMVALVIGLSTSLPQFTAHGRQAALDMMVQRTQQAGQAPTPEMYARVERMQPYLPYIAFASTFILLPVISVLFGAIYWAVFNTILGGMATFGQVLGVVTHASVIGALGAIVAVPIQWFQDGPPNPAGPFNLGALVPMLEPTDFLFRWLSSVSVFMLWQVAVSAIGLGVLYKRRTTGILIGLLSVYLLVTAGLAAAFPSLSSR